MKKILLAVSVLLALHVSHSAETQTIAYPTVEKESFEITAPKDWEIKQMEEEGDYFHLIGPTGAVFSFRTIEGSEDSIKDAIERSLKQLDEDYKNIDLGDAQDWSPSGLKGFYATGTAVGKKDNDEVTVGLGWAALEDGKIAEFWFVADLNDTTGKTAAEKIANSLKTP